MPPAAGVRLHHSYTDSAGLPPPLQRKHPRTPIRPRMHPIGVSTAAGPHPDPTDELTRDAFSAAVLVFRRTFHRREHRIAEACAGRSSTIRDGTPGTPPRRAGPTGSPPLPAGFSRPAPSARRRGTAACASWRRTSRPRPGCGLKRNVVAGQAVRVAAAVPALVVVAHARPRCCNALMWQTSRSPITGCSWMWAVSSGVNRPGFCNTSSRMPILPTSCRRPARYRSLCTAGGMSSCRPSRTAMRADALAVAPRVGVLGVDGGRQAAHQAEKRVLKLLIDLGLLTMVEQLAPGQQHQLEVHRLEQPPRMEAQGDQPVAARPADAHQRGAERPRRRRPGRGVEERPQHLAGAAPRFGQ